MQKIQHGWQKFVGLFLLALLIVIGIAACTDGSNQSNITIQTCDGVVNVDSCTSANSDAQYTAIAEWQQNTYIQQQATQTSLNTTVAAQTQGQDARDIRNLAVEIGAICGGIACLMACIAFGYSFHSGWYGLIDG